MTPNPSVLNSWKEIASYLGRSVRTVQRWERDFGLPVHRPAGKGRSATFALPTELDQWLLQMPTRSDANRSSLQGGHVSSSFTSMARPYAGSAVSEQIQMRADIESLTENLGLNKDDDTSSIARPRATRQTQEPTGG